MAEMELGLTGSWGGIISISLTTFFDLVATQG